MGDEIQRKIERSYPCDWTKRVSTNDTPTSRCVFLPVEWQIFTVDAHTLLGRNRESKDSAVDFRAGSLDRLTSFLRERARKLFFAAGDALRNLAEHSLAFKRRQSARCAECLHRGCNRCLCVLSCALVDSADHGTIKRRLDLDDVALFDPSAIDEQTMGVAAIFGIFAATYYWFPKMFGRMMSESMGRIHFWITFIGTYAIFMPMHYLGLAGHPRRYSQLTELAYLHDLIPLQKFMTYAAFFTIGVQLVFLFNLFWSMFKGPKASDNPWEATTLEWTTATPPPHDNFGGKTPVVHHGPYEYSVPGAPRDYTMQTDPATVATH